MSMYNLFYYPRNASWAPHMIIKEIGVEYTLTLVDRRSQEHKTAAYLKLNPTGRIPTLIDNNQVIFESAAIALHLCEQNPECNLIPALHDPKRPIFYQWLFYLTTTVQSELLVYFYPKRHTSPTGDPTSIKETQEARITEMFALIDKELEGKCYLLDNHISVCDFFLFMMSYWASGFSNPPLSFEHLGKYLRRVAKRPSVIETCKIEKINLEDYQ